MRTTGRIAKAKMQYSVNSTGLSDSCEAKSSAKSCACGSVPMLLALSIIPASSRWVYKAGEDAAKTAGADAIEVGVSGSMARLE